MDTSWTGFFYSSTSEDFLQDFLSHDNAKKIEGGNGKTFSGFCLVGWACSETPWSLPLPISIICGGGRCRWWFCSTAVWLSNFWLMGDSGASNLVDESVSVLSSSPTDFELPCSINLINYTNNITQTLMYLPSSPQSKNKKRLNFYIKKFQETTKKTINNGQRRSTLTLGVVLCCWNLIGQEENIFRVVESLLVLLYKAAKESQKAKSSRIKVCIFMQGSFFKTCIFICKCTLIFTLPTAASSSYVVSKQNHAKGHFVSLFVTPRHLHPLCKNHFCVTNVIKRFTYVVLFHHDCFWCYWLLVELLLLQVLQNQKLVLLDFCFFFFFKM